LAETLCRERVAGVGKIAEGRGRKSWLAAGTVGAVVHDTIHNKPDDGSTHWTTRSMASRHGSAAFSPCTTSKVWINVSTTPIAANPAASETP
jgi:hypothetical protein